MLVVEIQKRLLLYLIGRHSCRFLQEYHLGILSLLIVIFGVVYIKYVGKNFEQFNSKSSVFTLYEV